MTSAIARKPLDIKKSLIDALVAGLLALIVFGPIMGVVLDGYSFNLEFKRVGVMMAVVMLGRFLRSSAPESAFDETWDDYPSYAGAGTGGSYPATESSPYGGSTPTNPYSGSSTGSGTNPSTTPGGGRMP